eukprot:2459191-Pleurochrysis_carterae.AAC.1
MGEKFVGVRASRPQGRVCVATTKPLKPDAGYSCSAVSPPASTCLGPDRPVCPGDGGRGETAGLMPVPVDIVCAPENGVRHVAARVGW